MKTHWHTKALLDLSILISPISMNFMKRTHLSSKHAHGPWSLSLTQCIPPRSWPSTRTDLRKHGPKIPTFGRQIPGRLAMPDQIDRRGMSYTCRRWQGRKCTSMPVTTWSEPSLSQEVRVLFIKMLAKSFETFCIFPWALHSSPPSTIYDSHYDHPNRSSFFLCDFFKLLDCKQLSVGCLDRLRT